MLNKMWGSGWFWQVLNTGVKGRIFVEKMRKRNGGTQESSEGS